MESPLANDGAMGLVLTGEDPTYGGAAEPMCHNH